MNLRLASRPLAAVLVACGIVSTSPVHAVRVNPDSHGQVLIYPYYTARSTADGRAFVTALSVTNITARPKAVRVRFFEGRAGAAVLDFNLFLAAYDVWTAGIVGAGAGAGLFSGDQSCTTPMVSRSSASPTKFRNGMYLFDPIGGDLDRTYEGYFEILEMGTVDPTSALAVAVTPVPNSTSPNASKPLCSGLPVTDAVPVELSAPSGGLMGNASYINVNDGTDFSINAIALSQWSDRVRWSGPGSIVPTTADASPATSLIIDSSDETDRVIITRWSTGRDAISALFMVDRLINDYSAERAIRAATDWVIAMPTKRFYLGSNGVALPFNGTSGMLGRYSERLSPLEIVDGATPPDMLFDREAQDVFAEPFCGICLGATPAFNGIAGAWTWLAESPAGIGPSQAMASTTGHTHLLRSGWINGWAQLKIPVDAANRFHVLVAPSNSTTVLDTKSGAISANLNATYFGLPLIGFAVQSYSTHGLPGINPNVLSNYGGQFSHKFTRRIGVAP